MMRREEKREMKRLFLFSSLSLSFVSPIKKSVYVDEIFLSCRLLLFLKNSSLTDFYSCCVEQKYFSRMNFFPLFLNHTSVFFISSLF